MESTNDHYSKILGLDSPWEVAEVELSMEQLQVDVSVTYQGHHGPCPKCGKDCPIYDHSPGRRWRHLDTMQLTTILHASPPRVTCPNHGVKTLQLPWAQKHSRFTLMFEAFAIQVLQASRCVQSAAQLLGISWDQIHQIMERAVQRGLDRREEVEVPWVGMDEKSFRKGHRYISLLNDLENSRVIEVIEGREGKAAEKLITKALNSEQREMVCGVAIDMSAPFIKAIREHLPHADIVHDRFHISQHLGEAVDKTRRREHRELSKQGKSVLTGKKYDFLRGMEQLSDEKLAEIKRFEQLEFEVSKAWYLKELFRYFWSRRDKEYAKAYFNYWLSEVKRLGVDEMKKVGRMLSKHLPNILTYFDSFITNAISEGLNSKIQSLKSAARGFRNFENYRIRILFFCGKLNLTP
jgi:transposase